MEAIEDIVVPEENNGPSTTNDIEIVLRDHLEKVDLDTHSIASSEEGEEVDPRVQGALEELNLATDEVNLKEKELDAAKAQHRQVVRQAQKKLTALAKELGKCVEKARPYFDAKNKAKSAQLEAREAAIKYEKANSEHTAAREMISVAESSLSERTFDSGWQEMMNHATLRVMQAENKKRQASIEHKDKTKAALAVMKKCELLGKELRRSIRDALPYYNCRMEAEANTQDLLKKVNKYTDDVAVAKKKVAEALKNLNDISMEIHTQRIVKKRLEKLQAMQAQKEAEAAAKHEAPIALDVDLEHIDTLGSDCSTEDAGNTFDPQSLTLDATPEPGFEQFEGDFSEDDLQHRSSSSSHGEKHV
eukprot:Colp12_sorted_trinity150504_noHs@26916